MPTNRSRRAAPKVEGPSVPPPIPEAVSPPVVVRVVSPLDDHGAMVAAYAIAAEALRRAMETDMVLGISDDSEDVIKVYASCEAIRQTLVRASTRKNGP